MGRVRINRQTGAAVILVALLAAGVALISVGAWMIYRPAGLISAGVCLVAIGLIGFFGVDVEGERP